MSPRSTALAADHNALEDLNPGPGAFGDPHMDFQRVPGPEIGDVGADLGLLQLGDRGVRGYYPQLSSRAHRPANAWHRLVGVCQSSWALRAPGRAPAGSAWCGWQTSVCHIFSTDREASVNEHLPVACVEPLTGRSCGQPGGQVGAQRGGPPQRLVAPPAGNGRMVPGQQDRRTSRPRQTQGPVRGPLEQAVHGARTGAEIVSGGLGVAEDTGQQAADRVHHHQHGGLPPDST